MAQAMSAIVPVLSALVTQIQNSTALSGLVSSTGVYNDVPQGAAYPYIEVALPTETRWDTWGAPGKTLTVQVQAVTHGDVDRGDRKGAQILDACIRALHFQRPSVTSHHLAGIAYESGEAFSEMVSGVRIRHTVGIFRVQVTQST